MAKVRCEVTGPLLVDGVGKGGTVELDDEVVQIDALVAAGHVKLVDKKPKTDGGG